MLSTFQETNFFRSHRACPSLPVGVNSQARFDGIVVVVIENVKQKKLMIMIDVMCNAYDWSAEFIHQC